jgi:hypothetical protein
VLTLPTVEGTARVELGGAGIRVVGDCVARYDRVDLTGLKRAKDDFVGVRAAAGSGVDLIIDDLCGETVRGIVVFEGVVGASASEADSGCVVFFSDGELVAEAGKGILDGLTMLF